MRLIDADALKKYVSYVLEDSDELLTSSVARKAVLGMIDMMAPTGLVACKDCRWYDKVDWCNKLRISGVKAVEETWFCADGERKNDAAD